MYIYVYLYSFSLSRRLVPRRVEAGRIGQCLIANLNIKRDNETIRNMKK